jgi:hypothetical protein
VAPDLSKRQLEGDSNSSKEVTADCREEERGGCSPKPSRDSPKRKAAPLYQEKGQPGEGSHPQNSKRDSPREVAPQQEGCPRGRSTKQQENKGSKEVAPQQEGCPRGRITNQQEID